ncbi:uncharacterized protein LOC132548078 [Ylistrum balloti]|uniref:uncharacterized protein LOC132548078 n=1 Tax=Ylistrum balloti TaxID=509963 RepID=UPI002905F430|nr:uncharacterized protein LOC132548078 [Ylistrum balloti]
MIPRYSLIILILVLFAVADNASGKSLVVKQSTNDNDSDNDNDNDSDNDSDNNNDDDSKFINIIKEAMEDISAEIDEYIDLVPETDKKQSIEVLVETKNGYDVETKKTVINGSVGDKDAKLYIEQAKVLGKNTEGEQKKAGESSEDVD